MTTVKIMKGLVFALTFAIFFGLFIFAALIPAKNKSSAAFIEENIVLDQPLGSNIKNVLIKDNYLYIVISGGSLADRIVIADTNNGRVVSNISLN
ncbi:MAG: hypothetical protein LBR70_03220 [Lactobacillaceae bacterium]|nr:hypothetical protein [Lactobacillaceae bacterium]